MDQPNIDVFLSQLENEIFTISQKLLRYSDFSKNKWQTVRSLADDCHVVTKKADKSWCVVVLDRSDYILEIEKQLTIKQFIRYYV